MKPAYFTSHPDKKPRLKSVFFERHRTGFTSSTFPIPPDFSPNQPAAITLNTGSPRTLILHFIPAGGEERSPTTGTVLNPAHDPHFEQEL
jgi:hypothetical protein